MSAILKPRQFRSRLVAWFKKNGRDLPWRRTRDPYAILVSEIMLQQTQVATVIDYFHRWMKRFPDFPSLESASEADVLHAWQGLGYYSRARNLHRAAQIVVEKHGGNFPKEIEAIRELPGIGPYTAGAVATFAFDHSTPIIDANIARVIARLFDWTESVDSSRGRQFLWRTAEQLQPANNAGLFNSALMELGALVCVPRQPMCSKCPVEKFCLAKAPGRLPIKQARRKTVRLREQCAYIYKGGKVLLQQEHARRWRGLWKLPLVSEANGKPLVVLEYPFTHHRITLMVFAKQAPKRIGEHQRWFDSIEEVAMPSPHLRAVRQLFSASVQVDERRAKTSGQLVVGFQ